MHSEDLIGPPVAEDVTRQDIDLATWVAEERAHPVGHPQEGPFSRSAALAPVRIRNDEEEMLDILRDVRLPDVFEVMVVRHRSAPLYLGDDPLTVGQLEVEVRAGFGDDPGLRLEEHFLFESQDPLQYFGNDALDLLATCAVNVRGN